MKNLLAPGGWRFASAAGEAAQGRVAEEDDGPALVIEHAEYAEGSRWEQDITGLPAGTLLTFIGHARTWGECLRSIGDSRYVSGVRLTLEAVTGNGRLESVETVFPFPPLNPDGTVQEEMASASELEMIVPDGADAVRVGVELSGKGTASFFGLTLAGKAMDRGRLNDRLVDRMKAAGDVYSPAVERAFRATPRHFFLPGQNWGTAYRDDAIVTHHADRSEEAISSSSQPTMMAVMLEQLEVEPGMRVLEIGAGTGYNSALLAHLTGDPALVWTVDVTKEFCAEAGAHLQAASIEGVHVVCADGWGGWPQAAPYDRIIVTANAYDIAPAWMNQLADGGRLVVPWGAPNVEQRCLAFRRDGERLVMDGLHVCSFMRMRGASEWTPAQDAGGWDRNDWLFPGQPPGEPTSLIAYPSGTAPAPGEGEFITQRRWFDYVASWGGPSRTD